MKLSNNVSRGLVTGLLTLFASTVSVTAMAGDEGTSSGFLSPAVEAKMTKTKVGDKRSVMRWISPDMTHANYHAIMIDRAIFYPAPNPGPQVSSSTLDGIAQYLTDTMRKKMGAKVSVVDKAGPGVLRMQPAITAVIVKKEGLSAKDIIPVHLLFSAASAASGHMDENVTAMIEVRVTDSVSGDYRAAVKMDLKGKQLENEKAQLTVEDFQKSMGNGAAVGATTVHDALSK
jgi:hypothetical protein